MKTFRIPLVIVVVAVFGRAFNADAFTLTNFYSFGVTPNDGSGPQAGLVAGSDGNFYGTTRNGGTAGQGTIFRISPSGAYTNLYSFGSSPKDGSVPSVLVQASDTNLYGTAFDGGASFDGAVFRITPGGSYSNLYSFAGYPNDGANPRSGLVQGYDGYLYGTAEYGGAHIDGTVFRISLNGSETNLYSFGAFPNDGSTPVGGVVQGRDTNFYGTTYNGGGGNIGTIFRISPGGAYTSLYSFGSSPNDGQYPEAPLVQGSDGNFYGTTSSGGTSSNGTVFRISPGGAYSNLYSFAGPYAKPSDGASPQAGLVEGGDTNFYGTTAYGGTDGYGNVFRISPGGSETNLHCFTNTPDGQYTQGGLVEGSDGNFYGTTENGGKDGEGTVFQLEVGLKVLPPPLPPPSFQSVTLTNGTLSLSWSAASGATYQLQYNLDLTTSNWIILQSNLTSTTGTLTATDVLTNVAVRFYRLALSP